MDSELTLEERLHSNYNSVGVAVMQAMYTDDYLSIGGTASTDELARLANITSSTEVLDIGCGVGGPALHLAAAHGCMVTGIDLVASNIEEARQRAHDRDLTLATTFRQGDATALPFGDDSFDVVVGQDAWCHIPDKSTLLHEVHRALRPGGTVAFTDWLAGDGMTATQRQAALQAALCDTAATAAEYLTMLHDTGFGQVRHVDTSEIFVQQYQQICVRLAANRSPLTKRFGERVYDIVAKVNTQILAGFEGGAIGGGRFIASVAT